MRTLGIFLLAALTTPSTAASQSTLRFTLPFGQNPVGFRTVNLYDYSRASGDRYDANGNARMNLQGRQIPTSIWYPAVQSPSQQRMRYREYIELYAAPGSFPSRDALGKQLAVTQFMNRADSSMVRRELEATSHATRNAMQLPGAFPVVIYAPGLPGQSFENALLMEYLASYGYIVIAGPGAGYRADDNAATLETEARDMEFLIGFARTIPSANARRLGVIGMSFGGLASVLVAMRNPAVGALVSLDGSIGYGYYHTLLKKSPFFDLARYALPSLFFKQRPLTRTDSLVPGSVSDFFKDIRYAEAYHVRLTTLGHQNFEEFYMRLRPDGPNRFLVSDSAIQSAGYERIARYTRSFLDAYLKGLLNGKAFLARSPTENGLPAGEVIVHHKAPLLQPQLGVFVHELLSRHFSPAEAPRLLADIRRSDSTYAIDEDEVNDWGYRLLAVKRIADAIGVFRLNVSMYPRSANAHDSLGEAYAANGERALAIDSYQRALVLDSTFISAAAALKKLKSGGGS